MSALQTLSDHLPLLYLFYRENRVCRNLMLILAVKAAYSDGELKERESTLLSSLFEKEMLAEATVDNSPLKNYVHQFCCCFAEIPELSQELLTFLCYLAGIDDPINMRELEFLRGVSSGLLLSHQSLLVSLSKALLDLDDHYEHLIRGELRINYYRQLKRYHPDYYHQYPSFLREIFSEKARAINQAYKELTTYKGKS